ncbi:PorP/SprF family type IX secretion system membrane protein [Aureispira anguillae]|uniref:PorP/SprF family type IX secretion system membrane protein n=1 Tax=Aureispira anguillae TaxID=2864201 RepID=A0A915YLB3_9BACT|nr:PorP/SprF family type IX secretion system membrane protein [Aureispira anguillae]BDS15037.1 PorP/SprF family type IX secretion system membrane protein [Aureispira anguillae]
MLKTIQKCIGVILLFSAFSIQAQQLPLLNHYIYNPYLYNPARTGQNDFGMVSLHFKRQWTSLPNSPFSGAISLESPIKTEKLGNMGLGGMLYVDQMHITTNVGGMATYAYHIPFSSQKAFKHGLSAGLSLGFVHQRFNYSAATVENPNDNQLLPSEGNGTSFDFSAGLDYQWKGLHIGAAMLQGLNTGLQLLSTNNLRYVNTRQWLVSASYKHLFGPVEKKHRFYLQPVFMGRIIENIPFQAEANVIVGLDGMGWIGVGYRSSNNTTATASIDLTLGVEIKRQFVFAYTFGIGVDSQLNTSMGTQHELMLAYRFGENKKIKQMQENMKVLKDKNNQLELTINENRKRTDSLQTVLKETNTILEQNTTTIQQQGDAIKENSSKIEQHGNEIKKNQEELKKLRKMIDNQPLKYKKVGEVFFDNGSVKLGATSEANLDAVKQALDQEQAKGNEIRVYIKGNASTNGDAKKNMELSMRRATAVRQYLVNKGLDGNKVTLIPMGEEDPTNGAKTSASGDSKDRRVDIIFTAKKPKGRL